MRKIERNKIWFEGRSSAAGLSSEAWAFQALYESRYFPRLQSVKQKRGSSWFELFECRQFVAQALRSFCACGMIHLGWPTERPPTLRQ